MNLLVYFYTYNLHTCIFLHVQCTYLYFSSYLYISTRTMFTIYILVYFYMYNVPTFIFLHFTIVKLYTADGAGLC